MIQGSPLEFSERNFPRANESTTSNKNQKRGCLERGWMVHFLEANKKSASIPLPSSTPGDADIQDFYAKLLTGNGGAEC